MIQGPQRSVGARGEGDGHPVHRRPPAHRYDGQGTAPEHASRAARPPPPTATGHLPKTATASPSPTRFIPSPFASVDPIEYTSVRDRSLVPATSVW